MHIEASPQAGAMPPEELARSLMRSRTGSTSERVIVVLLGACAAVSILTTIGIIVVLVEQAVQFFRTSRCRIFCSGPSGPRSSRTASFGVVPLVAGTIFIAALSMVVAIPLGLMSAIYLSEYASPRTRSILKPGLELLAGIPTVVYGYFALTFITPRVLQRIWPETAPYNVLAGSIAVGIMVLPMIASLSEDAIRSVPGSLREAAYGLGATKFEVSTRVVVPAALSGIVSAIILAVSRAVGETMIVALATGSRAQLVTDPREPMQAMTGYIVQVLSGDVARGIDGLLLAVCCRTSAVLMTLLMNALSQWFVARFREEYQ